MIQEADGHVLVTNDGATIMQSLTVAHPAARMLVELSKSQDIVAGDGTTSVVVLAGALLNACSKLLHKGIHPMQISESFQKAEEKAVEILTGMSIPVDFGDRDALIKAATTSLSSKVVSQNAPLLAPIAVDAVLSVGDPNRGFCDLKNVKLVKKLGGTVDDTEMVPGLIFTQKVSKAAGGPTRKEGAKIAVLQFCLSPPKTDMENSVVVSDYQAMDRILKEERAYIAGVCKAIKQSGANVILLQKSILRDAITDLGLHYLSKMKIMLVKDIERDDIEFICKTLKCVPIASQEALSSAKLGSADLVEEIQTSDGKVVKITGVPQPSPTVTVFCRGSNELTLDENERSLHDALCVVRCMYQKRALIPGGGAGEMEVSYRLSEMAKGMTGVDGICIRAFAEALEVIPATLAENSGLHPIGFVTELRQRHAEGNKHDGINAKKGVISNIYDDGIVQPLLVNTSAIELATECVRMILKIDDIIVTMNQ